MKAYTVLFAAIAAISLNGCAEINPLQAPAEVIRHPLGSESVRVGMSKDEVISVWGKPDITNRLEVTDATGMVKEEWIYKARQYSPIPLDAAYLSKNKYLYFDGNNLTQISDKNETAEE